MNTPHASDILGKKEYRAISYGGYRNNTRHAQPTVAELKEDMVLLHKLGIRLLRTYNVTKPHASNMLKAIRELKEADPNFEMYVMLGAWIDCLNAWTDQPPDHNRESEENQHEIRRAVDLANAYDDIVLIIAVGNEAMVKWAETYYVQADVILKWVRHLQELKNNGTLSNHIWITSSDNFASWGGGESEYHTEALDSLIASVDFVSMHTYPMHDTHYNPEFWGILPEEKTLSKVEKINRAMKRSRKYAQSQYQSVREYVDRIDPSLPIHIGETGWASYSNGFYGKEGTQACDEYKQGVYHELIRSWTDNAGMSCFYFQAFDEPWKDAVNPGGSENHFGLFTVEGKAKYAIWDAVDNGKLEGIGRNDQPVKKTFDGNSEELLESVSLPPEKIEVHAMD